MTVVSGQVLDHSGQSLPGVAVYAFRVGGRRFAVAPMTHTDLSGRWGLDLGPGEWTVRETNGSTHHVTVGDTPIRLGEIDAQSAVAPDPTTEDIARFMERRKAARSAPVTGNSDSELPVTGDEAPSSETRPPVASPIRVGDITEFLRKRKGE